MALLTRMLRIQAAVWALAGTAVSVAPSFVLVTLSKQAPLPDYSYLRIIGIMSIGLALMAVLLSQHLEDIWWWAWAFAITDAGIVTVAVLNVLIAKPSVSGAALWWVFAGLNAALAAGLLVGLGRAGQEKPFA
jgi:hypothetical protein